LNLPPIKSADFIGHVIQKKSPDLLSSDKISQCLHVYHATIISGGGRACTKTIENITSVPLCLFSRQSITGDI